MARLQKHKHKTIIPTLYWNDVLTLCLLQGRQHREATVTTGKNTLQCIYANDKLLNLMSSLLIQKTDKCDTYPHTFRIVSEPGQPFEDRLSVLLPLSFAEDYF